MKQGENRLDENPEDCPQQGWKGLKNICPPPEKGEGEDQKFQPCLVPPKTIKF